MKTRVFLTMSTLLLFAANPVFAMTHQQRLACTWTAGNCLDEAKILEKRIEKIEKDIKESASSSPEEVKKLEKKLQDTKDQLERVEG